MKIYGGILILTKLCSKDGKLKKPINTQFAPIQSDFTKPSIWILNYFYQTQLSFSPSMISRQTEQKTDFKPDINSNTMKTQYQI